MAALNDNIVQFPMLNSAGGDLGEARATVLEIQDAFRKGDYGRIADRCHNDIDWLFQGSPAIFPQIGHRHGKAAVFTVLAELNALYRFQRYGTDRLIANGNCAAGIADVTMMQRASGRVIHCRIASFYRIDDGLVVEYRGFTDSFDVAELV